MERREFAAVASMIRRVNRVSGQIIKDASLTCLSVIDDHEGDAHDFCVLPDASYLTDRRASVF